MNYRYTRLGEEVEEGNEELYNYTTDPEENHNLIDDPDVKSTLDKLRQKFMEIRGKARKALK